MATGTEPSPHNPKNARSTNPLVRQLVMLPRRRCLLLLLLLNRRHVRLEPGDIVLRCCGLP